MVGDHARSARARSTWSPPPGVAHANRLPVLLLPGDTFAGRAPDPVLQQVEHFGDPTTTVNDAFRPVSRYFDRITRPEQLLATLPQVARVLTDPADCGPGGAGAAAGRAGRGVRLPGGDVRAAAAPRAAAAARPRRARRGGRAIAARRRAAAAGARRRGPLLRARRPRRSRSPRRTASRSWRPSPGAPSCRTTTRCTAARSASSARTSANTLAAEADVVLAVGTRLQDFTTSSWTGFAADVRLVTVNAARFDAVKHARPGRRRRRPRDAGRARPRRWATGRADAAWADRAAASEGRLGRARSTGCAPAAAAGRRADLRPGRSASSTTPAARTTTCSPPPAACRASCTAAGAPARSSRTAPDLGRDDGPGVRLLLHGLRGRRALGRGDGPGAAPTPTAW